MLKLKLDNHTQISPKNRQILEPKFLAMPKSSWISAKIPLDINEFNVVWKNPENS